MTKNDSNQIGLIKMERNAKERMSAKEVDKITAKNITNNKAVYNQFKSFFNSSSLSQLMATKSIFRANTLS